MNKVKIYISPDSIPPVRYAAEDLAKDLDALGYPTPEIHDALPRERGGTVIYVGDRAYLSRAAGIPEGILFPAVKAHSAPGGGLIRCGKPGKDGTALLLGGFDGEGTQRAVYTFCTDTLGIDPFAFWTGNFPRPAEEPPVPSWEQDRLLPAPLVPLRCYLDSDCDELANLTQPYLEIDFSYWKEMIDSLVRVGYNALDLFDQLGRTEFITRVPYLRIRPGYEANVDLINRIIDYARDRGMKIQISFFLGWQFRYISDRASHDWTHHREEWLETWRYYLKETPIGRGDIFLNQPRDQKLAHPYRSSCDEDAARVFNEAFREMGEIIREHNPRALIVADLFSDGVDVYRAGFRPEPAEDFIISWPDNGYGEFEEDPEVDPAYRGGTFIHAGFWYNHLVQNPLPLVLERTMKYAFREKGLTHYCLVSGQTFRHFILNMEAVARLCLNPESYTGEAFLEEWLGRYFDATLTEDLKDILDCLHRGQEGGYGYIRVMSDITRWQSSYLPERECRGAYWETRLASCAGRVDILTDGYERVQDVERRAGERADFFHDYFSLPFLLLLQLNRILLSLLRFPDSENKIRDCLLINDMIEEHTQLRHRGDRDGRWKGWYNPETARPNGGYPKKEVWRNYH